jgi:hypothetical protein
MGELKDARGVTIAPGDTAIYGFGVGRSVAMAEAVVLGDTPFHELTPSATKVSLTASGRVRLRVVRRSYSSGEKPIVDVLPDRLVVLKQALAPRHFFYLPPSPLPTQAEKARVKIEEEMESYTADLRSDRITWGLECFKDLAEFHAYAAKKLAKLRRELEALDGMQ